MYGRLPSYRSQFDQGAGALMMDAYSIRDPEVREVRLRSVGSEKIVFVSGNFNVVHPGHLRLLKFAAEAGDFLVVGVNPDSSSGVTLPAEMRLEGVRAISLVNHAFLLQEPPESFIAKLQPDVVVKGKEFETLQNPEHAAIENYGGKLVFGSGEVRFSSLNLLQREYFELNLSSINKPKDYPARHGFGINDLRQGLSKFSGVRALVIGDLIVDEYINCDPLGMSQEDPTIVLTPIESKTFVGGAGIVAAHAAGLGADVEFLTVSGADESSTYAQDWLTKFNVKHEFFADDTRPTTRKQRFRAQGKTLLRVNHLRQHAIGPELIEQMVAAISARLPHTDLLLFSDFNYGCLPQALVENVAEAARARGVMMVADSQASSQLADISRFKDMTLITPTEREARLALRDFESGLVIVGQHLQECARAENVIVTLGTEGLLLHAPKRGEYHTDRLPAFNMAPKDVAGAGDSFFTCCALALCTGTDIWQSTYLGALAAACQVSRVGNIPLTTRELMAEINHGND
jgi:rfaE bifunctional protein kinase chain/domain